jgi:hypothetical protein
MNSDQIKVSDNQFRTDEESGLATEVSELSL